MRFKDRVAWIDWLRLVAVFAVIWIHSAFGVVDAEAGAPGASWWIANFADAAARWCVPVLVMISGYLLLPSPPGPLAEFYRHRFTRLLVPTVLWSVVYFAYRAWRDQGLSAHDVVQSVVGGVPYYHLWFLYMLLGLSLVTPFLSAFVANCTQRELVVAIVVGFALAAGHSMLTAYIGGLNPNVFSMWLPYVPYYLAGAYFARDQRRYAPGLLVAAIAVCAVAIAVGTWALLDPLGRRSLAIMYGNLNPLVIVMSLGVFLLFRNMALPAGRATQLVHAGARLMLGVYAIHPLWIDLAGRCGLSPLLPNPLVGIPMVTGVVFLASLAACFALSRLPGGRWLVS